MTFKQLFCHHNYSTDLYYNYKGREDNEGTKFILISIYKISECSFCGKIQKEKISEHKVYTIDGFNTYIKNLGGIQYEGVIHT